ncbi:hypothetical protein QQY66_19810 [Streptomyces sp. DG2A-72]|uniref:hypothetical protein n=1 Tax=Streptomyces sp. DG2A-72 TaxID=3051386 RepID=UPI00265C1D61|nr:hypothetical protein [Streptomyces sp. DG2A-72]MDO0933821.1 hypothetical protein [Streptomyces sp. DG2A-72]
MGPDAELTLTPVDAEHLHAALCRALDAHPAPANAPGCRTRAAPADPNPGPGWAL